MRESLRNLDAVTLARIASHSLTLRASLEGGSLVLGEAPHPPALLDDVWSSLVIYPVEDELTEWLVTAFGALVAENLAALYSFRWKLLQDEYGESACMIENRTKVKVFPFDAMARRIQAGESAFFGKYFGEIEQVMAERGIIATISSSAIVDVQLEKAVNIKDAVKKQWWRFW